MNQERRLILLLATIQFTDILDFMIVMPLGKTFIETFGIDAQQFSFIVSIYAIAAFVSGLFSATIIDRFDRKQALLLLYAGFILGTLACAFSNSYVLFLAARALTGFFGGIIAGTILAVVSDVVPFERRSSAMGMIMTGFSVASIVGVPVGLWLAAHFGWRTPFWVVAAIAALVFLAALRWVPSLRGHLVAKAERPSPLATLAGIFRDPNQRLALYFTLALMLGHFSIIPFIAPYMQFNVGFADDEVAYIYLVGGGITAFMLPLVGRIADRVGNAQVFTVASLAALFAIYGITNLGPVGLVLALVVTSSYFLVSSGRSVPATTLVTSAVSPERRASFMSIRTSINQGALALGSIIAGAIVVKQADGTLLHYEYVGYIAMAMSLLAIWLAWKIKTVS